MFKFVELKSNLTTNPNPFFKSISFMRPYPLKNFSTSLSLACGLSLPINTRELIVSSENQ